jgi:osmotically-inducible protein OsmY
VQSVGDAERATPGVRRGGGADGTTSDGSARLARDVRERLLADDRAGRAIEGRVVVAVAGAAVTVTGYVRTRSLARRIADLASSVPGVAAVDDRLVADDELVREVGAAIARTPLNRISRLTVRADHGHIRVGGSFPSAQARAEALRAAALVPGVLRVGGAE